jgi:hypothetical protein
MTLGERAQEAINSRRVSVFLKILSVFLLLGAASHLGSILGIGGTPWLAQPLLFRIADSVMLPLNLVMAWGLWRARLWAVCTWLACILLLQFVPFLLFTDHFVSSPMEKRTLYGLLATHASLVSVFLLLLLSLRSNRASEDSR